MELNISNKHLWGFILLNQLTRLNVEFLSCCSVRRIRWVLRSISTSPRMTSSRTLFSQNRLNPARPSTISRIIISVRHEVSARPWGSFQLRRPWNLQVCGLHHWLAAWQESHNKTGIWLQNYSLPGMNLLGNSEFVLTCLKIANFSKILTARVLRRIRYVIFWNFCLMPCQMK